MATYPASSPALADIQAAIALASDGDTVTIPAGTATWTSGLSYSKAIIIQGAGVGQTIVRDDLATTGVMWQVSTTAGKSYRITGIEFRDGPATRGTSSSNGLIAVTGTSSQIRLDNLKFEFPSGSRHLRFIYLWDYTRGVMHDITWNITGEQAFTVWHGSWANDAGGLGNGSWSAGDQAGTAEMWYVEDCDIIGSDNGGLSDGFAGARFAVRYSLIRNGHLATHGTESTGRYRGTRWVEVYESTFEHPLAGSNAYALDYRSGSGVFFNNTGTGGHTTPLHMSNYRDVQSFKPWGMADGRNPFDINDDNGGTNNPFDSGTSTGGSGTSGATLTDSTKSWIPNQWAGYHLHRTGGDFVATSGSGQGTLVVAGAGWVANQWTNWSVRDLTTGRTLLIASNTSDAITTSNVDGSITYVSGQSYRVFDPRRIDSNTATTLTLANYTSGSYPTAFAAGQAYTIWRCLTALDMPGMGQSDAYTGGVNPSPVAWPNQATAAIHEWGNSFEGAGQIIGASARFTEGTHYVRNTAKPGYTPYTYPHPLRGALAAPTFLTEPANQTVDAGNTAILSAVATGNPSPTYQWRKGGVDIVGATSATLTIVNAQEADEGSYTCVATNSEGSVTSNAATLTVNPSGLPEDGGRPYAPTNLQLVP